MLSIYGIEWNCHHRNWNWSRIAFIGIGIGVELPLSELELELNCLLDWVPDSELEWNCLYRNWNWNWIAKTELTPALVQDHSSDHPFQYHQRTHDRHVWRKMVPRLCLGYMSTLPPRKYVWVSYILRGLRGLITIWDTNTRHPCDRQWYLTHRLSYHNNWSCIHV